MLVLREDQMIDWCVRPDSTSIALKTGGGVWCGLESNEWGSN